MLYDRFMMGLSVVFLMILLPYSTIIACECQPIDMRTYDYIALVKIKSIEICNEATNGYDWMKYEVNVETIETFIGEAESCIEVLGSSCRGTIGTSCDLCLDIGEEWIISGRDINGIIVTQYCSLHQFYRSKDHNAYPSRKGIELLNKLCSWKSSM